MILKIENADEKARIAGKVLSALPQWFGIPESTRKYIEDSRELPFWAWNDEGFIVMKPTSRYTAEIYVMGVMPQHHRQGAGRALMQALKDYAVQHGYEYLQVKTVQKGRYPEYDRTNAFYEGMGFRELECFPDMWDARNPCQIYVSALGAQPLG